MQTFRQIQEDLQSYAASIDLSGVAVDKLCLLLAYSEYKNQILQTSDSLEFSFSSSLKLNSRIHHAADMMYSVPRGRCPRLRFKALKSIESKSVKYLDFALLFNGYYFYYSKDAEYDNSSSAAISEVNLIGTSKPLRSTTVSTVSTVFYVDFIGAENVSNDYILYEGNTRVSQDLITEDSSEFYFKKKNSEEEYVYTYKYLVITIPNFGIRVIRHSDTQSWDSSTLTLSYLVYCETLPSITAMSSIPGFSFIYDDATKTYTEIETVPFEERLTDLNQIYVNATASFLQQGSVATIYDLEIALKKKDSTGNYKVINDVEITRDDDGNYTSKYDSLYTTVVYTNAKAEDIRTAIEDYRRSMSVTKSIVYVEASAKKVNPTASEYYVEAVSSTLTLTNEMINNITNQYQLNIGGFLDHSTFEADIVKLGFDSVKVYTDKNKTAEATFSINCEVWEFPVLTARVLE